MLILTLWFLGNLNRGPFLTKAECVAAGEAYRSTVIKLADDLCSQDSGCLARIHATTHAKPPACEQRKVKVLYDEVFQ